MDIKTKNQLLATEKLDRDDLWPKLTEYDNRRFQFRWEFGLDELPEEPGILVIRGPRQTGKSTWLEFQLLNTIEKFGPGSAFFLNGDYIYSHSELEAALLELEGVFRKDTPIKRIFIDEITQIKDWQRVIKRLIDSGHLRDVLIITTGSNAADLLHGGEKLPGRKGQLAKSEYIFLPISFREFCYQTRDELCQFSLQDRLWVYMLTGGNPLAAEEFFYKEHLSDTFIQLIQDWVIGDLTTSGRSRQTLAQLLAKVYEFAPSPVSYTKLAKEAGLANNSAALDYVERLTALLVLVSQPFYDIEKKIQLFRKPSKFSFINLPAAMIFHPAQPRYLHEIKNLNPLQKGALFEWVVATELWRRSHLDRQKKSVRSLQDFFLGYWKNDHHEIDFVLPNPETPGGVQFFEVKAGPANPLDFSWFRKIFPKAQLQVISESSFETEAVSSMSLETFLWSAPSDLYFDEDRELPMHETSYR